MGLNVLGYQFHLLQCYHPACGHLRIFPSLPCSRLTIFYRDASSALLQLLKSILIVDFLLTPVIALSVTAERIPVLVFTRIELTPSALLGVVYVVTYF